MNEPLDLSVVIIAFNEEANLPRCLKSLPPGSEIIVLDSGSTDRTAAIAQEFGARVYQRPFTNFAEHKNAALAHATRRWVLSVDADEELDASLRDAISGAISDAEAGVQAYRVQRRLVFMGRRMHFGKTRDWPVRLFLRSEGRYVGSIHEELKVPGRVARLAQGLLWHYSYRDLSDYFVRFNRYTTAIAERHMAEGKRVPMLGHLLRPWLEFVSRYVFRLGFLDGYPGYTYALISSLYAYIKYAKIIEKRRPS
ncbi:MAG TPA: glycosyltransferase family 2 protein [Oligoflexus sp.]|uniref:glycosyltransferase family 2 protein n=1 Tax=Oligoflexus sp. TaxID=1971216 RepID=UPI002D7EB127|nr:glycosyltransferase family 2 protein [Oligoflexus sp.]HET9237338.1 glycosyltransferase family 2 protein [Oligoflexus sp.]